MKTTSKLVLAIAFIALCSNVSAQTLKFAHINLSDLIVTMPEYDTAQVKLQKVAQELDQVMEEMRVEMNRKWDDYQKNQANWSDLVKQSKMDDLNSIQQRIQAFQEQAQETYQQENDKLLQPVVEKANKAIDTVAKEQGVNVVLNAQVLHYKDASMLDLLPAVKKHLGITK